MYSIVRTLQVWKHYLLPKEFVIHSDHEALKYIRKDILCCQCLRLFSFEHLKELYLKDEFFSFEKLYDLCAKEANGGFYVHEGFLFKDKSLCVPKSSIKELLVKVAHEGCLMGNFGDYKTYKTLLEHFFRTQMKRDVHNVYDHCLVCKYEKAKVLPGYYSPFHILSMHWIYIFLWTLFWILMNGAFYSTHKNNNACIIANLFFMEVMRLRGLPRTMASNKYSKFLNHFWTLWSKLGIKLLFSTACHP
ncbi:hypothetical protein CR513_33118, partial [Mucuna pruriens]